MLSFQPGVLRGPSAVRPVPVFSDRTANGPADPEESNMMKRQSCGQAMAELPVARGRRRT